MEKERETEKSGRMGGALSLTEKIVIAVFTLLLVLTFIALYYLIIGDIGVIIDILLISAIGWAICLTPIIIVRWLIKTPIPKGWAFCLGAISFLLCLFIDAVFTYAIVNEIDFIDALFSFTVTDETAPSLKHAFFVTWVSLWILRRPRGIIWN